MSRKALVVALAAFASGFLAGRVLPPAPEGGGHPTRAGGYRLISPLLDYENDRELQELRPFKHRIKDFVDRLKGGGVIAQASVYYRDLNNGPWFGIGEKEQFTPASLLKVPNMIAWLKGAESDSTLLARRVRFQPFPLPDNPSLPPERRLEPGKEYTIEEYLRRMIVDSDNQAQYVLRSRIDGAVIDRIYADFGLKIPDVRKPEDMMSVKEYGAFFRILYNASYLDRERSEKALRWLSEVRFDRGLPAGVPAGTVVAHKFGEREAPGRLTQFHDCGVVYHPRRPYLLCLMTRGKDIGKLVSATRDISSLVWAEVDKQTPVAR